MGRLLICDDERAIGTLLQRFLAAKGHDCVVVESGEAALEVLTQKSFDVLITDLNLDGMDGFGVLRSVRELDLKLPVLFTTGAPSQATAIRALREGAFDYLLKPFSLEEVYERIERAIELSRIREENAVFSRLVSLQAASKALAATTSVESLVEESLRLGARLLRAQKSWYYFGGSSRSAVLESGTRFSPLPESLSQQALLLTVVERAYASMEPVPFEDKPDSNSPKVAGYLLALPIELRSSPVGVLILHREPSRGRYQPIDLEVGAQLACTLALNLRALANEQGGLEAASSSQWLSVGNLQVEETPNHHTKTIVAWAELMGQLVDQHCPGYESKLQRVFAVGKAMIQNLDWRHVREEDWRLLSQVYDLAKLRVPQELLRKRQPLTQDEKQFIRLQSQWATERLSDMPGMAGAAHALEDVQEAFDGSGLPRGKRGHAISAPARLLAVVDAYVAMTSNRPYRPALDRHLAVEAIRQGSGTRFDPEIVLALSSLQTD